MTHRQLILASLAAAALCVVVSAPAQATTYYWDPGTTNSSAGGGPGTWSTLGGYSILPRILPSENRYQFVDNLSWVTGRHAFKFGVDIARTEDFVNYLSNRFGSFTYSNVTTFAQDYTSPTPGASHYSSYSQVFGNPIVDMRITDLSFYAQDTWKISNRLTANYGLRYERALLPQPAGSGHFLLPFLQY